MCHPLATYFFSGDRRLVKNRNREKDRAVFGVIHGQTKRSVGHSPFLDFRVWVLPVALPTNFIF